jgi:hypothetical protein
MRATLFATFFAFFFAATAFAAPDSLILKNNFGEQSTNTVLGGTLVAPISLANLPSGGAAAFGDANVVMINQTTASQTITLPAPSHTVKGIKQVMVINVGSSTFSLYGQNVAPSTGQELLYTGSAYVPVF